MRRIVILGGGFSGLLAAVRLGSILRGVGSITLVNASSTFVERVRLHQVAAGQTIPRTPIQQVLAPTRIALVEGRVVRIDCVARLVHVDAGADRERAIAYEHLIHALGSSVDLDRVPGARTHALSVTNEASAVEMARDLASLSSRKRGKAKVVVVGGGLTGIEIAAELAEAFPGLDVALMTAGAFGASFSPNGQAHIRRVFGRHGIAIHEERTVEAIAADHVVTSDGELPANATVMAAAFGVSSIAKDAGLAVNDRRQILVDPFMRSISHPEVFAVGDAAVPATSHVAIRMGCATAMPMAACAVENLAATIFNTTLRPFRYAYLAQFVSLGRRDALAQFTRGESSPRATVLTGGAAARMKEMTFDFNMNALRTGFYPWRLMDVVAPG